MRYIAEITDPVQEPISRSVYVTYWGLESIFSRVGFFLEIESQGTCYTTVLSQSKKSCENGSFTSFDAPRSCDNTKKLSVSLIGKRVPHSGELKTVAIVTEDFRFMIAFLKCHCLLCFFFFSFFRIQMCS